MRRKLIPYVALLAAFGLGACNEDSLVVTNPTAGETKRVLGTPDDAEKLLGSYYRRWYQGLYGGPTANPPTTFEGMANIMSFQNYSSLNNECQNSRYPFSGASNGNSPGNGCAGDQENPYFILQEVNRVAANFLSSLPGFDLRDDSRENRDKAFAEFLNGISLGYIALFYDQATVVVPGQGELDIGKLIDYKSVMDSAYASLDRAFDYAKGYSGELPGEWIPSSTKFTGAEFGKLIKSYKALFRANIARTPAERAAANWDLIIADAQAGITADHYNTTSTTNGPGGGWRRIYDGGTTWHQMPAFIIGMADTSGNYQTWLQTPLANRGAGNVGFFMATPDKRFPQGSSRAAQQKDFAIKDCEVGGAFLPDVDTTRNADFGSTKVQSCKRYFTNRPDGSDQYTGAGWGWSNYNFNRFHSWVNKGDANSARNGTLLVFPKTVLDMLQAEGMIRKGDYAGAATLINVTRVRNGLPPVVADGTSPVPGGTACVPRVPQPPDATTTACGNIMEAMKWEKRMESAYVQFAAWFLDSRGWGDLAENTALFWAVPFRDLQARGYKVSEIYGAGPGAGNAPNSAAAKSVSYGW
jgi:hypothetical protein